MTHGDRAVPVCLRREQAAFGSAQQQGRTCLQPGERGNAQLLEANLLVRKKILEVGLNLSDVTLQQTHHFFCVNGRTTGGQQEPLKHF